MKSTKDETTSRKVPCTFGEYTQHLLACKGLFRYGIIFLENEKVLASKLELYFSVDMFYRNYLLQGWQPLSLNSRNCKFPKTPIALFNCKLAVFSFPGHLVRWNLLRMLVCVIQWKPFRSVGLGVCISSPLSVNHVSLASFLWVHWNCTIWMVTINFLTTKSRSLS